MDYENSPLKEVRTQQLEYLKVVQDVFKNLEGKGSVPASDVVKVIDEVIENPSFANMGMMFEYVEKVFSDIIGASKAQG